MTNLSERGFSAKLPFKQLKENKIHVSADCAADTDPTWQVSRSGPLDPDPTDLNGSYRFD